MKYQQSVTRARRTLFLLLIDCSESMSETIRCGSEERTKADLACEMGNTMLCELVERARRSDGIHDYYDVGVIGYSGRGIGSLLGDEWWLPVDRLAAMEKRTVTRLVERTMPDGRTGLHRVEYPCWFTPSTGGRTPMYEMFALVDDLLKKWCEDPRHAGSFPPMLFHLTDGEASDCDEESLVDICRRIRSHRTDDGEVLLLNNHLSSNATLPAFLFPASSEELGENRYARLLYDCSSTMPACFEPAIRDLKGTAETGPFRGMSYNCSIHELTSLLNIGSVSIPLH